MSLEIGIDISSQMSFRILTGMLLGPLDFETEKDLIILISSRLTGWRKIEFWLFIRGSEKWWLTGGIVDLTLSATDVKKLLKVKIGILCFLGL